MEKRKLLREAALLLSSDGFTLQEAHELWRRDREQ